MLHESQMVNPKTRYIQQQKFEIFFDYYLVNMIGKSLIMKLIQYVIFSTKVHYTRVKHMGDVSVPGANGLCFQDADTLYISRGNKPSPTAGSITKCSIDLRLDDFIENSCSYNGIALGPEGAVVVRNAVSNELEVYSPEKTKVCQWRLPGGKHQGMVVSNVGQIYVCDAASDCIRLYEASGELVQVIRQREIKSPQYLAITENYLVVTCAGEEPQTVVMDIQHPEADILWSDEEIEQPMGVAFDENNDVYVCDAEEKRIVMLTNGADMSFNIIPRHVLNGKPTDISIYEDKLAVLLPDSGTIKLFQLTN